MGDDRKPKTPSKMNSQSDISSFLVIWQVFFIDVIFSLKKGMQYIHMLVIMLAYLSFVA